MNTKSRLSKTIKKIMNLFRKEVKTPVYIPIIEGQYLKDRVILITGGGSGIGLAIAKACIRNGAKVIITGRNTERLNNAKEHILNEINMAREQIYTIILDVMDVDALQEKMRYIVDDLGLKPDTLINNAGASYGKRLGITKVSDFDDTINTNLRGTYFMSQVFSNYLIKENISGNILNISSASGNRPAISPYMVSKCCLNGLTKGLAKQLIKHNIVVNGIAPGPTITDMIKVDTDNMLYENSPAKRYIDSNEIANISIMLISLIGRMIVGETIYVTGGCGTLTFDDIKY